MREPEMIPLPGETLVASDLHARIPRCLLVGGNAFDRSMLRYSAERGGIEVEFADAGTLAEARRHLAEEDFELIITDQHLPDGDALALTGELAGAARNACVAIIMLGSDDAQELASASRAAGCVAFTRKQDLSPAWLSAAMRAALAGSLDGAVLAAGPGVQSAGTEHSRIKRLKPLASRLTALASELRQISVDPAADAALEELSELTLMLWIDLDDAEAAARGLRSQVPG